MAMTEKTRKNFEAMKAKYKNQPFFARDISTYMSLSTFNKYWEEEGIRQITIETPFSLEDIATALNESVADYYGGIDKPIRFSEDDYFIVSDGQICRRNKGYIFKD